MPKPDSGYRPRLAIEITPEQHAALQRLFPYGTQRAFFSKIIDEVLKVVELGGTRVIAAILTNALEVKQILPTIENLQEELEDGDPGGSTTP